MWQKKKSSYLKYWDTDDLYGWAMSQKFPIDEWDENTSQFNKNFRENYNEDSNYIFLKLMYKILKIYLIFTVIIFTFLTERMKIEKVKKFKIKKFKTGIKSWINIEKRYIESWNLTINLNKELRKNAKKWFQERFFQVDE